MNADRTSRAGTLVYASVIGPVGCQEIALDVWHPSASRAVIFATLRRTAPDLRLWDASAAEDLAELGRPERTWTWEGDLTGGYNSIVPEWLLVGLTPGKYVLHLALGDGQQTLFTNDLVIQVEGVLLDVTGASVASLGSIHTVTAVLQPVVSQVVEDASIQLTDPYGRVIVPECVTIVQGGESVEVTSATGLALRPGQALECRFDVRVSCPGSGAFLITVYDGNRRRIGRGIQRYHALPRGTNGQPPTVRNHHSLVAGLSIPEWAYRATISKIYNPVDPTVIPDVVRETRSHGVSVFSWETHKTSHFKLFPTVTHEARQQGLRTLAYTGAVGLEDDEFLERYPDCADWVVRDSKGRMRREWDALPFAPASPYFNHYRAPFFRYLAGELDGVFADISNLYRDTDYSAYSMREFTSRQVETDVANESVREEERAGDQSGRATPSEQRDFYEWNEWRYETVAALAVRARDEMKAVSPDAVLSWNMAESIGRLTWSQDYGLDIVRLGPIVDAPLVECNYIEGEPLWILGANARYYAGAAPGKPIWVALRFDYPDGKTFTPAQVEATMAEIYANGASAYIDWQPVCETLQKDESWLAAVDRMFSFVRGNEDLFVDEKTRTAARVAMVYSRPTNDYWKNPERSSANAVYQGEFLGWYLALLENGIQVDVIAHERLGVADDSLQQYEALVLPNVAALSDQQAEKIARYAETGGTVLATWQTGQGDACGTDTGVNSLFDRMNRDITPEAVGELLHQHLGNGRLVHVLAAAGRSYWERRDAEALHVMQQALRMSGVFECKAAEVRASDGNVPMVEAVAYRREDDTLLIHLVNWSTNLGDWYSVSHAYQDGEKPLQPITEIHPAQNLTISVRLPAGCTVQKAEWVTVGSAVAEASCSRVNDQWVEVTVPQLTSLGVLKLNLQ